MPAAICEDSLAFSPDSTTFAVGCEDGSVRLWDVATARPVGPPRMVRGRALGVAFSPDGGSLLAVGNGGDVRSWLLPSGPSDEPDDRLIDRVQARTDVRLGSSKEVVFLDPEDWRRPRSEIGDRPTTTDLDPARVPRPGRRGGRRRLRGALAPRPLDRDPPR